MTPRTARVAVVGAGPAGLYVADHLTFPDGARPQVRVDLFERLPVPFGLLRYGVAPDHLNIKAAGATLQEVLERPGVELFCNVEVGRDITVPELRAAYDAVVYAIGASADKPMGIPGEQLAGSVSATAFVNWYNGHPDSAPRDVLDARSAVVIGVGNVAVDVARMLLHQPGALDHTDVPQHALEALARSAVTDVHVLGRRGAEHAKFTTKELRELGELPGVDVLVTAEDIPAEAPGGSSVVVKRNLGVLREWSTRTVTDAPRRLHLHFGARPVTLLGTDSLEAVLVERTTPDGAGTGDTWELPAQLVLRAVGYRATPVPGIPFEEATQTIPAEDSRVLREGRASPGEYAVGWARRGATGVLGTNRSDAEDAVRSLRADLPQLLTSAPDPGGAADLLAARDVRHVDLRGFNAILAEEEVAGALHGRGRVKLSEWGSLLAAAERTACGLVPADSAEDPRYS